MFARLILQIHHHHHHLYSVHTNPHEQTQGVLNNRLLSTTKTPRLCPASRSEVYSYQTLSGKTNAENTFVLKGNKLYLPSDSGLGFFEDASCNGPSVFRATVDEAASTGEGYVGLHMRSNCKLLIVFEHYQT